MISDEKRQMMYTAMEIRGSPNDEFAGEGMSGRQMTFLLGQRSLGPLLGRKEERSPRIVDWAQMVKQSISRPKRSFDGNDLPVFDILYDYQFGFRKFHSTNFALIDVIDNILEHLDVRDCGVGICIDLQKAFDAVNHDIILRKS